MRSWRRAALAVTIVAVALALVAGGSERPTQARGSVDGPSAGSTLPRQEDADEVPVQGGTEGGDTCCVLDNAEIVISDDHVPAPVPAAPYRWVARLKMAGNPGGEGGECTGFLIGPRTVITAGHCVYYPAVFGGDGWAASVDVIPSQDGTVLGCPADPEANAPFGCQTAPKGSLWSVQGWFGALDPDYDYGAVILDEPFPGMAGPFFFFADIAMVGLTARLSGYPCDRHVDLDAAAVGTPECPAAAVAGTDHDTDQQFFDTAGVTNVAPKIVSYAIDGVGAQSGSPVWEPPDYSAPTAFSVFGYGQRAREDNHCNDGVDNDHDDTVDDGCPGGPGPVGAPEVNQCANATGDDDADGTVNDGCFQIGVAPEAGISCANVIDDDGDTAVNDGCPAVGTESPCILNSNCGRRIDLDAMANLTFWLALASPVGGIAQLPDASQLPAADHSGSSRPPYDAVAGGLAAAVLTLTAGAWYARRRRAR